MGEGEEMGSQYWVCWSWHLQARLWRWESAARGGSLCPGERAGTGRVGAPIAGARRPASGVLQEGLELKRGPFKSKERFELKRRSERKIG